MIYVQFEINKTRTDIIFLDFMVAFTDELTSQSNHEIMKYCLYLFPLEHIHERSRKETL